MAFTYPINLLGTTVSGDVGGMTAYTDRFGKKVFYPKAPPDKPPSEWQARLRNAFKLAQQEFMGLTPQQKADWETLIKASSLCMTGQNLFIHTAMIKDFDVLETIERQTNTSVVHPTPQDY